MTALLTVVSIPLVIPFFQILFEVSELPSEPSGLWDLDETLHNYFSTLIGHHGVNGALVRVCGLVVLVFAAKNLCRFLISYFMIPARNALLRDLRKDIWSAITTMPLQQRYHMKQGYLLSLITNDLSEVDHGILKVFELLFKTPLIVLGSLGLMIWLSPKLTVIAFALILFTLFVVGKVSHVLKKQSAEAQEKMSAITSLTSDLLTGYRSLIAFDAIGFLTKKFSAQNESYLNINNRMLRRRDAASPLSEFMGVITVVALLYAGAQIVLSGQMNPGTFFAFVFAFYNIIDPAKSFSREYANVQRGLAALDRINSFIDGTAKTERRIISNERSNTDFTDVIELRDVSLSFGEVKVFDGLSLRIQKGRQIGIVGISGVGKTSLFDLLLRLYEADTGTVTIDGRPIKTIQADRYRKLFGLVSQKPFLLYGTLQDNILLDKPLDEVRLKEAIRKSSLDESLLQREIGDLGAKISGGQAQRVEIARVYYRDPDIILFDEPTSMVDQVNERELLTNIKKLSEDKTVLMVTHNPSLLRDMDEIIVLHEGRVEAKGSFELLIVESQIFSQLVGHPHNVGT